MAMQCTSMAICGQCRLLGIGQHDTLRVLPRRLDFGTDRCTLSVAVQCVSTVVCGQCLLVMVLVESWFWKLGSGVKYTMCFAEQCLNVGFWFSLRLCGVVVCLFCMVSAWD